MSINAKTEGAFTARKHDVPRVVLRFMTILTIFYGVILTGSVPFALQSALNVEGGLTGQGEFDILYRCGLIFFGSFMMLRWCAVQILAFLEYDRLLGAVEPKRVQTPFVSILVPAYNESDTIVPAIQSLLALDYPNYEVIVVDDGSKDDTYSRALLFAGTHSNCSVKVITKPNGGKWSALNEAYRNASGQYLLCVDADSRLSSDALRLLVVRFEEPGVAAVAGQVTVRNRNCLITRLQAMEYVLGNGGMRMALSRLGLVTVVPGPIGLYKRSVLAEIESLSCNRRAIVSHSADGGQIYGPLSGETFAEDFQLSLTCLALGYRVVYEPRAFAYTKAPDTIDSLISQRYRWMRGTWQVIAIYVRDLRPLACEQGRSPAPMMSIVMLALYTADIYIVPILNLAFWVLLALAAATAMPLTGIAEWIGAVALLNMMTATLYVLLQDDDIGAVVLVPFLELYQAILVNGAWFIAAVDEIRGSRMRWHA